MSLGLNRLCKYRRYCQLYNTSKEILVAGMQYPFQNDRLDDLSEPKNGCNLAACEQC